ncbi:MAG: hypothetical protein SWH61_05450 [Thermodesulfobacteriota bacterium]|nr:hypothetical protein [Thermodesulfobacteriota bacterium]
MTTGIWQAIEDELELLHGRVVLLIDGYTVTYIIDLYKRRMVIFTYVNGEFRGEWALSNRDGSPRHPESRFLRPVERCLYKPKELASYRKAFGAKAARTYAEKKFVYFDWTWYSPKPLIRHLKKNFKDIELIERGYHGHAA